jgi:hypothetical protein
VGQSIIDVLKIAERYKKWFESHPFDIGATTTDALEALVANENQY